MPPAEAKAQKSGKTAPRSANLTAKTNTAPGPAANPNAPLTKEQKLNDLDRRYKSDEITPLQYQNDRAKILAEP